MKLRKLTIGDLLDGSSTVILKSPKMITESKKADHCNKEPHTLVIIREYEELS